MKKVIYIISIAAALFSCGKYDDSALISRLEDQEARIAALEDLCSRAQSELLAVETIVTAFNEYDWITKVEKNQECTLLTFASGRTALLHNGASGSVPEISITLIDGKYYWTVNGEVFKQDGNPVEIGASGKDAVSPLLKIENRIWYVSYDEGKTWTELGEADGFTGGKIFSSIVFYDDYVEFVYDYYDPIRIPLGAPKVSYGCSRLDLAPGESAHLDLGVSDIVKLGIAEVPDGWKAFLDVNTLSITAPLEARDRDEKIKLLVNAMGRTTISSLTVCCTETE